METHSITLANPGKPATAVGLAVGSVDAFEERLFDLKSTTVSEWRDPDGYQEWVTAMTGLAGDIRRRRDALAYRCKPLNEIEPECDGPLSKEAGDLLRPIGAKVSPGLSLEQATAWRKAVVMALSDMPPDILLISLRKALHVPFKFLNEVEEAVRNHSKAPRAILALGVSRLNRMLPKDVPDIRELRHFGPKEDFPL